LLRGGCYESFGKPHDGLGFAPMIMHHLHGSTALCGLAYEESGWPDEYRDNLFVGNVMTCRVHRDRLEFDGSTPRALEQHDLVATTDPWFRPVDLQFGPDGALYVADFYNRIIGHYEVPLDHPGRDRTSGRIWRIAYVGEPLASDIRNGKAKLPKTAAAPDLRAADAAALVDFLAHPQQAVRMRALDELTDRIGSDAFSALQDGFFHCIDANQKALCLWGLHRLGRIDDVAWFSFALENPDPRVRVHALHVIAETGEGPHEFGRDPMQFAEARLEDSNAFVNRAAADALCTHSSVEYVDPLLQLLKSVSKNDSFLRHVALIALRHQLEDEATLAKTRKKVRIDDAEDAWLARACMGLRSETAGSFLLDRLDASDDATPTDRATVSAWLGHAADVVGPAELDRLAAIAQKRFAGDAAFQLELIRTVQAGLDRRSLPPPPAIAEWAGTLIDAALAPADVLAPAWRDAPVPGNGKSANPWMLETRHCADGVDASMLSSLPKGEALTGTLRSPPFAAPARLAFFCCGHNGELDRPAQPLNCVRIRDAATNALLAQLLPPRNDVASRFEVDLAAHAGKQVVVELVDGSPYDAYAWLAAGRFEPPLLTLPTKPPGERSAEIVASAQLAAKYRPQQLAPRLAQILKTPAAEPGVRAACAAALVAIRPDPEAESLAALLDDPDTPPELIEPACAALADGDAAAVRALAIRALEIAPSRMHAAVAAALARTPAGAGTLLESVARGKAPPALLTKEPLKGALIAALPADGAARIAELTKGLPPEDEARQKLINDRRRSYARIGGDAAAGLAVFTKNCAVCHRFAGAGAVVGPQLDGIASRGFERIFEDVLAPNRNVDVQFVRTNYFLKNGDVVSALFRREEGATIVVADEQGKETALARADVKEQHASRFSLMPDGFGESLDETQLRDLVAYLMSAR
jgi:putative heme-binding domain-containing protein